MRRPCGGPRRDDHATVRSQPARTTATLAALLLATAIAACGRPGASAPPGGVVGSSVTATGAPAVDSGMWWGPSSGDTATRTSTTGPSVAPTPDPVASALDQINQLINDLDNSLSNSDSSQQGGE
jgi:hypothetical protein